MFLTQALHSVYLSPLEKPKTTRLHRKELARSITTFLVVQPSFTSVAFPNTDTEMNWWGI